jgi:hypothetical protein
MALLQDFQELSRDVEETKKIVAAHEERISGERGLSAALNTLSDEVKSLRRALYTAGGGFVLAAIGFGFAALRVVGAA